MPATRTLRRLGAQARTASGRAWDWGRAGQRRRCERWRSRLWLIVQCSLTAALSWAVCQGLLHHAVPFFGPVASIICLNLSFGQRLNRAVEVSLGVALGILTGELFVHFFGQGVWQIAVVCFLAMSVATWLGAKNLMIIQAGLQSITVLLMFPGASQGIGRWLDGLVGCTLALLVAMVVPTSTYHRPRILAAGVLRHLAETLRSTERAIRADEEQSADEAFEAARATATRLAQLETAAAEGLYAVRWSPFLRQHVPFQTAMVEMVPPLQAATRDLRVLGRRGTTAVWRDEPVPDEILDLLPALADAAEICAGEVTARRLPIAARRRLLEVGEQSSRCNPGDSLSAAVILGQCRFMIVDLLRVTGMPYEEARVALPEMG